MSMPARSETSRTSRSLRRVGGALAAGALALGTLGLTAAPADAASRSLATRAEYKQIRPGQTLSKVRDIIDSRGTRADGDTYLWKSTAGKVVVVEFDNGRVVDKQRLVVASLGEYRKIRVGDSYDRVKRIIGGPSLFSFQADEVRIRVWPSPDLERTIILTFDHGKVIEKERDSEGSLF